MAAVSAAVDYSQALLTIGRLLKELKGEEEYEIPKLVAEIPALVRVQTKYKEHRLRLRKHPDEALAQGGKARRKEKPAPQLKKAEIEVLQVWVNHAVAAYGREQFVGMNIAPRADLDQLWTDEDSVSYLTGMKAKHIYKFYADHGLYKPGYYVAVDHKQRSVVLAMYVQDVVCCIMLWRIMCGCNCNSLVIVMVFSSRGSNSVHDAMVDIVCEQQDHEFAGDPEHTKVCWLTI